MEKTTILLQQLREGDKNAADELFVLLYDELRRIAARKIQKELPGQTLQGTALVNEVYQRLIGKFGKPLDLNSRNHFLGCAARAMQQILIDKAREKKTARRGGHLKRVAFDGNELPAKDAAIDDEAVGLALEDCEKKDPRAAEVFRLKYFCQLTAAEIAAALNISESTVNRDWSFAKSYLFVKISGESE